MIIAINYTWNLPNTNHTFYTELHKKPCSLLASKSTNHPFLPKEKHGRLETQKGFCIGTEFICRVALEESNVEQEQ